MRLGLQLRRPHRSRALNQRPPTRRHPRAEVARRHSLSAPKSHECEQFLVRFRGIPLSMRRQLRFHAMRFLRYRNFPANRRARRALPKASHALGRARQFRRLASRWRRARFSAYRQAFARPVVWSTFIYRGSSQAQNPKGARSSRIHTPWPGASSISA